MCRELPSDITYDRWLTYIFDHPVRKPHWWFDDEQESWDDEANQPRALEYLTRFFSRPGDVARHYSRAQIDQGLTFLIDNGCSAHAVALANPTLPWRDRRAGFDAVCTLYSDLLAPVYGNDLAHIRRDAGDPERPNFACFMLWEMMPVYKEERDPEFLLINRAVLHIFRETLKLKSEACLESVLHGLGHWWYRFSDQTEPMVREFLETRQDISRELRAYAERAARGAVQ